MADRVVRRMHSGEPRPMAAPSVQAKCDDCLEEEKLQRQAEDADAPDELLQARADGVDGRAGIGPADAGRRDGRRPDRDLC